MHIIKLKYPGQILDLDNDVSCHEIQMTLKQLENSLVDASIAIFLFQKAQTNYRETVVNYRFKKRNIEAENFRNQFRKDIENGTNFTQKKYVGLETLDESQKKLNHIPNHYFFSEIQLHAHSFLYSIDCYSKCLNNLGDYSETSNFLQEFKEEFDILLPSIRKIRNSVAHIEDRIVGIKARDRGKKRKLEYKCGDHLKLGMLSGNKLGYTIDNGTFKEIAVEINTVKLLENMTNRIIEKFKWKGVEFISPSVNW